MHLGEVCLIFETPGMSGHVRLDVLQLSVEYCYKECEFPRMFTIIESRTARDGISKGEIPI